MLNYQYGEPTQPEMKLLGGKPKLNEFALLTVNIHPHIVQSLQHISP